MQSILSICVVTMNRAKQLKEALESCLACLLPKETEFIIIDNASSDNTEQTVHDVLAKKNYYYEKKSKNLGCGGGRNYAYSKASGKYIYVLDDDAVIDSENSDFFIKAIDILDTRTDIVTLTTQIYDTAWKDNRLSESGCKIADGLYKCKMFCGGSHFIRKSFFNEPPYLSNKYGYEEIKPSLQVIDAGKINAFYSKRRIIHKPVVNKWVHSDEKNFDLLINECAVQYAIKKMMYPTMVQPLVWLAYNRRCRKHLSHIPKWKKRTCIVVKDTIRLYPVEYTIKMKTILVLYINFGISIF